MKLQYKPLFTVPFETELESDILSHSIVEIESAVTVEEFKDGFSDSLGSDGFEVDFN